jgi:hypothetical protein
MVGLRIEISSEHRTVSVGSGDVERSGRTGQEEGQKKRSPPVSVLASEKCVAGDWVRRLKNKREKKISTKP